MRKLRTLSQVAAHIEARSYWREDGCLIFTGALNKAGYAHVGFEGRTFLGHRLMYLARVGPIPDGLFLDHQCHNRVDCRMGRDCPHRACVNPAHLEPATAWENKVRSPYVYRSECSQGHQMDERNTYVHKGHRYCRACNRAAARRSKERRMLRAANVPSLGAAA